ncbi:MAG: response regulator transcription factor [Chloroflexota bacterium]|nr:MAG: response regulator transcription factor [Chloroflexota bacterium]
MTITVFLADDHAIIRDGLRALLEKQLDIEVVGDATNGLDAVRLVGELEPDVVVIDIAMPQLNGIEATRQILNRLPSARVIVLSMFASEEHIYRALDAGASGYLVKESAGAEVATAVRHVAGGRRYFSQLISDKVFDEFLRHHGKSVEDRPLDRLTSREREILQLVVEGKSSAEVAVMLSLSPKTVDTYRSRLMKKLQIADLPGLVKFAIRHGLTPLE